MPLSTESDEWKSGSRIDRLTTNIGDNLLINNKEKAYTVEEIAEWVKENYPENLPPELRENENKNHLISLVAAALDRLDRRRFAETRYIKANGSGEMYYTYSNDDRVYPMVRIEHDIKPRLDDIETDISDLKDSINWLDSQIQQH